MKRSLSYVLTLVLLFLCFSGCRIQTPPAPTPLVAMQTETLARRFYSLSTPEKTYLSDFFKPYLTDFDAFTYMYENGVENEDITHYTLCQTNSAGNQSTVLFRMEYALQLPMIDPMCTTFSADGNVLWLVEHHEGDVIYGGTDPSRNLLLAIDRASGTCLRQWNLMDLWDILWSQTILASGNTVYVLMEYDTFAYGIACFDVTSGTVSEVYKFEGIDSEPTLITLADGRVAVVNKESRTVIPFAAGTVTPEAALTAATDITPEVYLDGGDGGQFFYIANGALYGDGKEPLLHLAAQGVNVNAADIVDIRAENGAYSFLVCEDHNLGLYTLTPCTAEEAPTRLTVAGYRVNDGIHTAIKAYNRAHFDHTAVLEDYKQYDDNPNGIIEVLSQQAGITKLNTELLAGKEFDLLALNEYVSAAVLTRQGALADLYPLMDADSEMNRSTFVPTILEKTEKNGKLYHLSTAFGIRTLLTNPAVVGDLPALNIAGWNALAAAHPGIPVSDIIEETFLYFLTRTAPYDFVSTDRAECTFDSPVFVQYLKTIEKQYNESEKMQLLFSQQLVPADYNTLKSGAYLTLRHQVAGFEQYQYILAHAGENMQFTGFPSENGAGHQMEFANTLGILSTSQNIPAAWEFLKLAVKENTLGMSTGGIDQPSFPCDRASFEAQLAYYCDPVNFTAELGTDTTVDGLPRSALSKTDIAALYTVIEKAKAVTVSDRTLSEIIYTEGQYYLGKECTAEEAAARIQERAQVYLSEQQ